ncbi:MAG: hypothetical protein ABUL42_03115 [Terricaulis silvestris]
MRASAIALIAALGLVAATGPAMARAWPDPAGRLTLDLPAGWSADTHNCEDCTFVDAFNPSRDCYVLAKPRTEAQAIQPAHVRAIVRDETKITQDILVSNANDFQTVFPNNSATFVSRSLDDTGFWPIVRTEFTNADGKHVHGAMQMRSRMELWAFCVAASGTDSATDYDTFFKGLGTPQDATLQTEVQTAEAAAAAQAAAPPPPPPPPQRNRRDTRADHPEDH